MQILNRIEKLNCKLDKMDKIQSRFYDKTSEARYVPIDFTGQNSMVLKIFDDFRTTV